MTEPIYNAPALPEDRTWLQWLWLFPLPQLAWLMSVHPVGEYRLHPRWTYLWWPAKGYHVACGTRILHPKHNPDPNPWVLDHEVQHLWQQELLGGVGFLLEYAFEFLAGYLFHPDRRFRWKSAYRGVWMEQDAYLIQMAMKQAHKGHKWAQEAMANH